MIFSGLIYPNFINDNNNILIVLSLNFLHIFVYIFNNEFNDENCHFRFIHKSIKENSLYTYIKLYVSQKYIFLSNKM